MRIRTQFIITMLCFGVLLLVMAASEIITNRRVDRVGQQEEFAANIAQWASELSYLANDYLIYRESQQLKRWQSRSASLSALVAGLHATRPELQALVANMEVNQQRLKEVFDSVASGSRGPAQNQGSFFDPTDLQVSWSRMAVQTQGLVSDASRLSLLLRQQMNRLITTRTLIMYIMVILFGVFLLSSYMLTYRRILKSVAALRAGTAVIGAGNLEFTIEEKKNDEIGDLSRAFNRMTSDLKAVTASKTDLEREMRERRQAEEALREAHERALWLARFPDENPNPIVRVSADGTVLYHNPSAVESHGWTCADGLPLDNRLLPLISRAMAEGKALEEDVEIGKRFYSIGVAPFPGEDYANIYGRDITERKRAEDALRMALAEAEEGKRILDAIMENVPEGLTIADAPDGTIRMVSRYGQQLIGSLEGITMRGYEERFNHRRADGTSYGNDELPLSRSMLKGEVIIDEEVLLELPGGRVIPLLCNSGPIRDRSGAIVGGVVAWRDITRLKEAQKDLEGFAYSVSHDLRAPLRAIDGFVRILLRDHGDRLDKEARRKFNLVRDNARKMGQLVDDLLLFSRVGRSELRYSSLDMNRLVREVVGETGPADAGGSYDIRVGELPEAYADRALIKQVMVNLLSNAIKFSRGKRGATIEIGALEMSGERTYYIKDYGVGFDMRYYDKLFGVFQRLHSEEQFEGTGVGLAIVHRIINKHGGRLWAEGKPGQGATFYFTLPKEEK